MNVFVTGGAGFIGRNLVKSFLEKNFQVTIFDDFSNSSKDMISDLLDNGAKLVKGDITVESKVSNAILDHDVVIHLAAKNNVQESIKNPEETFSTNVDGTKNILNSCLKHNIKNIIAASSAAVYGESENSNHLISEKDTTNPTSPYGESKLKMEQLIQDYSKNHNLNTIILRIFNVYGIGQSPEHAGVITKFLERISKNEPPEIFGDGSQTRDFVSIHDVVSSIHNALSKINESRGTIYNIASGKATSIKNLAEMMISISGKNLDIKYFPQKEKEVRSSHADISLAKSKLDFSPKIKLDKEIKNLMRTI